MIGSRLRAARKDRKLSLREIAEAMGVTAQAVSQWERSNPSFEYAKVKMLSHILEVKFEWLEGSVGAETHIERDDEIDQIDVRVPLLIKSDIIRFLVFKKFSERDSSFAMETIEPTRKSTKRGFAFEMDDESLDPHICQGDILIFDNSLAPVRGDVVFALISTNDGHFKLSVVLFDHLLIHNSPKLETFKVMPLQEQFFGYRMHADEATAVFGVMVEHRKFRPSTLTA